MEAIGSVYDGSKGKYGDGYWTMGVVALSGNNSQPIPIYEKLYPCTKQGGNGFNAETKLALQYLRNNFDKNSPRVFDRGFDSGDVMKELKEKQEKFIIRQNQNRVVIHKGVKTKINDVVKCLACSHELSFHSKTGNVSKTKIGMTQITIPKMDNLKLNLVVCKEFGENPLVLYTNLDEDEKTVAARIVKAYLMRWRIKEFYAFKKQGLNFEDFRVRSLNSIQTLDILLTVASGYIAMLSDKVNEDFFVLKLICVSKRIRKCADFIKESKFFLFAILDGISSVLARLKCGISHFFKPTLRRSAQLSFLF